MNCWLNLGFDNLRDIKEYLKILQKEVFGEKGEIVDDLIQGIKKVKEGIIFEDASKDFKRASRREKPNYNKNSNCSTGRQNDVYERCKLFGKVMNIS